MKLKSLKLAIAVALATPLMIGSGGLMAAECVGDELPNCDNAKVQINEDASSATDVQVSTTVWSGETSTATESTPNGLGAGVGTIRVINLARYDNSSGNRSAECSGTSPYYANNCRFNLSSSYMSQSIQAKIGDSNKPQIAAKNYPSSAGDDPARHTTLAVGAAGFIAPEAEYVFTFDTAVDSNDGGTPTFHFDLKSKGVNKINWNCNFGADGSAPGSGNGCWWTNSGTKLHFLIRNNGANQIDSIDMYGEGGNFNNGRRFTFSSVKAINYATSTEVASLTFPTDVGQ